MDCRTILKWNQSQYLNVFTAVDVSLLENSDSSRNRNIQLGFDFKNAKHLEEIRTTFIPIFIHSQSVLQTILYKFK